MDLKTFVDNNFNSLDIYTDAAFMNKATKAQLLNAIQKAIDDTPAAVDKIKIGSNNVQLQPPREPEQVNQTTLPASLTLQLSLMNNPLAAGGLDIFLAPYSLALSAPPPGYQYAGELFDLFPPTLSMSPATGLRSVGIRRYGSLRRTDLGSFRAPVGADGQREYGSLLYAVRGVVLAALLHRRYSRFRHHGFLFAGLPVLRARSVW